MKVGLFLLSLILPVGVLTFLVACTGINRLHEPQIGFIGDLPTSIELLRICVDGSGKIICNDNAVSLAGLCLLVEQRTSAAPARHNPSLGISMPYIAAVLSIDKALPWEAIAKIRHLLVYHKIYRIFLTGKHPVTNKLGALALYHPLIVGSSSTSNCVELFIKGGDSLNEGLKSFFSSLKSSKVDIASDKLLFQVVPRLSSSVGNVVYIVDMLFRAGAKKVYVKDDLFWNDPVTLKNIAKSPFLKSCTDSNSSVFEANLIGVSLVVTKLGFLNTDYCLPGPHHRYSVLVGSLYEGILGDSFWEKGP